MSSNVTANGRSILHKGHGMTHVCAPPDVCKTPSPAGPVPIPYPNIAMDSQLAQGAKSVKIGAQPVAKVTSKIATSSGDEPGTVGGIISSKFKGAMTWKMGSMDVKAEGKSVVRFLDTGFHNGNSFNSAFINMGGTGVAYADDFVDRCEICSELPAAHRVLERPSSAELCARIIDRLHTRISGWSNNKKKKLGSFMVGVMVCGCDPATSFASNSGRQRDLFDEVAGGIVDVVISGAPVSAWEMALANESDVDTAAKINTISARFRQVARRSEARDSGYNVPGNCAGAKLLARSGHAPAAMTEMFFTPRNWSATYEWLTTERTPERLAGYSRSWFNRLLQNRAARRQARSFTTGETVASCHSCQDLLYLTMCPERRCP